MSEKKFKTKEDVLKHYMNQINEVPMEIKDKFAVNERTPFVAQRNAIITLSNHWKLDTKNYLSDFIQRMEIEIEHIHEKKSSLSKFNRNFLFDLKMYIEHFLEET